MKKFLIFLLSLVVTSVLLFNTTCSHMYNIIVVAPLSSSLTEFGVATFNGVRMKIDEINANGGLLGHKIYVTEIDDKDDPETAKKALLGTLKRENAIGVIGAPFSRVAIEVADVSNNYKVPFISSVATNPEVTKGKEYAFRACFSDDFQGFGCAKFAFETLGCKKAGVIYDISDPYSTYLADAFKKEFELLGGSVVAFYPHPFEPVNFTFLLEKTLASKPDVIFCPDLYRDASMIYNDLRNIGFNGPVVFGDGVDSPQFTQRAKNIKDAYYSNHYDSTNIKFQEFVKNYTAAFNTPPNIEAYLAYDAAGIFFEAVKEANSFDSDKIVAALKNLSYSGITGPIEFKNSNDPIKPVYIYGFKGNTPYLVETIKP